MSEIPIKLPWWPPFDQSIDQERAGELVQRLQQIVGPVVDDAERDIRSRIGPGAEVVRSGAPASWMAKHTFSHPQVRSLYIGMVYQVKGNPAEMNALQLGRDGVLRWRREEVWHGGRHTSAPRSHRGALAGVGGMVAPLCRGHAAPA